VGIVRTQAEMVEALESIFALEERAVRVGVDGNREYNPGWHTAMDLTNLLTVSEAIARAAIERTESRGAQFRDDHPSKDPAWDRTRILVRKGRDGAMELERETLPPIPPELQRIIEENK
jgi:succinate dehydrogenase / fumarate reductase, flavoprotein subunit